VLRRLPSFAFLVPFTWVALYVNFCSGALVRVTNSGLGCPDWPLCHGNATPPLAGHAVIEFSNRILAALVIVTTLALAYRGWREPQRWLAFAIAAGTFAQGPLGGITIMVDLHPVAVASHFLLAIVVFSLSTILLVDVRFPPLSEMERPGWLQPVTLAFVALGLVLIVSGAIVTTSSTHPGADGVKRLYSLLDVTYWHVRLAATFVGALAVFLFLLARLEQTGRRVPRLAWAVVGLTALQIMIGETQWRHQLPWYLVWAHVMTATLLWGTLVALGRTLLPAAEVSPSRAPSPSPARA
jgi:cytochrome c oxidase assembly protein subunit 15